MFYCCCQNDILFVLEFLNPNSKQAETDNSFPDLPKQESGFILFKLGTVQFLLKRRNLHPTGHHLKAPACAFFIFTFCNQQPFSVISFHITLHLLRTVSDLFPSPSLLPFWVLSAISFAVVTLRERAHAVYYLQSITASGKTQRAGGFCSQRQQSLHMPRIANSSLPPRRSWFVLNSGQKGSRSHER